MKNHVVSKGLANPSLLWLGGVRLRVASHRVDEERAGSPYAGCYSPLHSIKVSDSLHDVKQNQNSLAPFVKLKRTGSGRGTPRQSSHGITRTSSASPFPACIRVSTASWIPRIIASREVSGVKKPRIITFFESGETTVLESGPWV